MASAARTDSPPYVGPRPFSAKDGAEFFGRDHEIAELLSLVVANRVVLLYAVSGAGKTSLLTAGLHAALTDHGFEVFPPLRVQTPLPPPDAARNAFVYATLLALAHRDGEERRSSEDEIDPELTLDSFLAELARQTDAYGFTRPRVLIFDQFEEIFTSYQHRWPDREAFVRQVAAALAGDPDLRVIFSLREEYIAQIDRYAGLLPNGLRARFHLERLRHEAALLAVRGPLQRRGIGFAPGVAETLIHDLQETRIDLSTVGSDHTAIVQGEFVEPVHLQVVCSTLWSRLDATATQVTDQNLAALGGVDDSLEKYYDDAIAAALRRTPVTEHKLRVALERALITPAGTRATVFASTGDIAGMPAAPLDELATRHVIRAEWRSGGRWLELSHDRLITPLRQSNARVLDRHRRSVRRRLAAGAAAVMIAALAVALSLTVAGSPRVEIMITSPSDGATYPSGILLPAQYRCTRASSCVGDRKVGAAVNNLLGTHRFTVRATGPDGSREMTATYRVERLIAVPAITARGVQGYASVLAKVGLLPTTEKQISDAAPGTVLATDPAVGTKVATGTTVTLLVAARFPVMAFDNDQNILLADSATGKPITPAVPKSTAVEKDPSWSPDGNSVVYTSGQQLVSANMIERKRTPAPLRPSSEKYADPSFAPIATKSVLAVGHINEHARVNNASDHDLCVGSVKLGKYNPQCIVDDSFSIGFAHWTPDGKTILAFATSAKGLGIVRYTSDRAFSTRKADWGKGKFVTTQGGNRGVWDLALSPDGKRLAAIANFDTPVPQLYLTTPDDIQLQKTKPLPVAACKLVWLDSRNLALVKLGDICTQLVGEIVRITVDDPTKATPLATAGDNPTFQPLSVGG
jgi:hypothetical protein